MRRSREGAARSDEVVDTDPACLLPFNHPTFAVETSYVPYAFATHGVGRTKEHRHVEEQPRHTTGDPRSTWSAPFARQ